MKENKIIYLTNYPLFIKQLKKYKGKFNDEALDIRDLGFIIQNKEGKGIVLVEFIEEDVDEYKAGDILIEFLDGYSQEKENLAKNIIYKIRHCC